MMRDLALTGELPTESRAAASSRRVANRIVTPAKLKPIKAPVIRLGSERPPEPKPQH